MSLYQPLQPDQARILILDPAPDRTLPIKCTLQVVSLREYFATDALGDSGTSFAPLPFEALSYVWGSPATNAEINVNGQVKRVGVNLERALRGLRRKGKIKTGLARKSVGFRKSLRNAISGKDQKEVEVEKGDSQQHGDWKVQGKAFGISNLDDSEDGRRALWIDAICINQQDVKEKTVQVRLMSRIYRNAARVLVWLGEGDDEIDKAVTWMKQTLECGLIDSSHLDDLDDLNLDDTKRKTSNQKGRKKSMEMEAVASVGLSKLISNEYWHRMWTAQEFGLAHSDPLLICGKSSFEAGYLWPALEARGLLQDMSNLLLENKHVQNSYSSKFSSMQTSLLIRHALKRRGDIPYQIKPSLGLFLPLTWARKCEDPRDKIFALYGLFSPRRKNLPAPDYDKINGLVIAEAVAYIMNEENDFDLLCYIALRKPVATEITVSSTFQQQEQPPSWLPDLFDGSLSSPRCPARFMTRHVSANGGLKVYGAEYKPFVSDDLRFFILQGAFIDRVQQIFPLTGSKREDWIGRIKEFSTTVDEQESQVRRDLPLKETPSLAALMIRGELQDKWQTLAPAFELEQEDDPSPNSTVEKKSVLDQMFDELLNSAEKVEGGEKKDSQPSRLERYLEHYVRGRYLFITTNAVHGLSTPDIREGDELYTISGIKVPFILRRVNRGAGAKYFRAIGGANVAGIMMGELDRVDDIRSRIEELRIV